MKAALLIFLFCLAEADDVRWEIQQLKDSMVERMSNLEGQNAGLASRLSVSETKVAELQTRLSESEKQQKQTAERVVFTAAAGGSGVIGPFNTETTMIYRKVLTNIGNAYSQHTGIFTAPVTGVYFFTLFFHAGGDRGVLLYLYKNGQRLATASDHSSAADGADNGGNAVTVQLQRGDQVYVRMAPHTHVWGDYHDNTTFGGFLLF